IDSIVCLRVPSCPFVDYFLTAGTLMAATDQNYRNQYLLDIVFAVTSILMLVSIVWMLWDDYMREYKTEQRQFRDVESAMAQREALKKMPRKDVVVKAVAKVESEREKRKQNEDAIRKMNAEIQDLLPKKERSDL